MKVVVNQSNCIGCGACESICPEVFQINDEGFSTVVGKEEDFNNHEEEIRDAVDSCPTGAITEEAVNDEEVNVNNEE
jgi:ferredoxin